MTRYVTVVSSEWFCVSLIDSACQEKRASVTAVAWTLIKLCGAEVCGSHVRSSVTNCSEQATDDSCLGQARRATRGWALPG